MISDFAESFFSLCKKSLLLVFIVSFFFSGHTAFAEMSSTNYLLQWDAVSVGGLDSQSSSGYQLRSTFDMGVSSDVLGSSSYRLDGGYRGGIFDPVSSFRLYVQDRASQVAAMAYSSTSVTVTSASGFSAGDRILVVQDEGPSQVAVMGKITSIAGTTLSVDAFSGGSPFIDGSGGDYVYRMTSHGTSLPLGTPASSAVITGIIGWEATADVRTGYSVYLMEDGNLRTVGGDEIPDVADGIVSVGSSEYGARSSDATLASSSFDTQDTAITSSPQLVASQTSLSFFQRDFITLKLGVSSSQASGSYSQNLSLVFSGNY